MANIMRRGRPSIFNLRRDLDDVLDDFVSPRGMRREIDRLWAEDLAPRTMWQELEQIFDDFVSPMSLRRRASALFEPFGVAMSSLGMGRGMMGRGMASFIPEIELIERDNEYLVKVDLPGVRSEDVDVSVDDSNVLTIRGQRRDEQTRESRGYEYTERSYGSFMRSIELPRGVDASRIDADHTEGVLQLHIPKTEQARARKIPIGMGQGRGAEREMGQGRAREPSAEQPRVMSPGNEARDTRTQANSR